MKKQGWLWLWLVIVVLALGFWWKNSAKRDRAAMSPDNTMTSSTYLYEGGDLGTSVAEVNYFNTTRGYYAVPNKEGNYPGVVMVHEWWGLNDNIKAMAQQMASHGYRVLAVDLYEGKIATVSADAQKYVGAVVKQKAVNNMRAAVEYLRNRGSKKIASFGWCFGGGQSLQLALSGEKLDATVIYYGSLETDKNKLQSIKWPVLGVFGDKDTSIPVPTVRKFEEVLTGLGVTKEIYIYEGVGHAFANPSGQNFAPTETKDAWVKTTTFLDKYLKESK